MTASAVRLCRLEELPEGESRGFDPLGDGHDTMLVVRRGNRLHAWRDACPHINGAPMAWRKDAYLNAGRDRIMCSAHGALFDIVTGYASWDLASARRCSASPSRVRTAIARTPRNVV